MRNLEELEEYNTDDLALWQPGFSRFCVADTGFNRWACKRHLDCGM